MWHKIYDQHSGLIIQTMIKRTSRYDYLSSEEDIGTLIYLSKDGKRTILGNKIPFVRAKAIANRHVRRLSLNNKL